MVAILQIKFQLHFWYQNCSVFIEISLKFVHKDPSIWPLLLLQDISIDNPDDCAYPFWHNNPGTDVINDLTSQKIHYIYHGNKTMMHQWMTQSILMITFGSNLGCHMDTYEREDDLTYNMKRLKITNSDIKERILSDPTPSMITDGAAAQSVCTWRPVTSGQHRPPVIIARGYNCY